MRLRALLLVNTVVESCRKVDSDGGQIRPVSAEKIRGVQSSIQPPGSPQATLGAALHSNFQPPLPRVEYSVYVLDKQ